MPQNNKLPGIERTADTCLTTYTGREFWPLHPKATDVDIEDIAHALSLICRFTGHTYCHYSVAEHSLRVSKLAEKLTLKQSNKRPASLIAAAREAALWGLLHDASEAYLCDMPSPLKRAPGLGPLYQAFESVIMAVIAERFDMPRSEPDIVKSADLILLNTEMRDLMTGCTPIAGYEPLPETIFPMDAHYAEAEFLRRFEALTMARKADRLAASLDTETYIAVALSEAASLRSNPQPSQPRKETV